VIIAYSRDWQYKDIGDRRQLFIDDDVIACVRNVKRTQHSARKHPANPLIVRDQPWEGIPYFRTNSFNVVQDPADGLFKCWYEDQFEFFGVDDAKAEICDDRIYYARSRDGIVWEKPPMGKLFVDGRNTNTVFSYPPYSGVGTPSVLLDLWDADPARRYKAVYIQKLFNSNHPKRSTYRAHHSVGVSMAFSPNGIDWTPYAGNPILPYWGSDVQILTYDEIDHKYLIHGRAESFHLSPHPDSQNWFLPVYPDQPAGIGNTRRCTCRTESQDCIHWTQPEQMLVPGSEDNLQDSYYSFVPWRAGEMHLGALEILHQVDNTLDTELLYSRDGRHWQRFPGHQPLISRGQDDSYDSLQIEFSTQPLRVGDELWLYYGGNNIHHDWWIFGRQEGLDVPEARDPTLVRDGHHLCLATLRLDGWVSLDATIREGYVETKPVFSTGAHLFINGRCQPGGTIQVEVMDNWNHVWPGYGKADCRIFSGDSVHHKVAWTAGDAVHMIPGIVKLRFHLRNAELYSFQIADS